MLAHLPIVGSHASPVHGLPSSQASGLPETHEPPRHVSPEVHRFPSEHPSLLGTLEHPLTGSHLSSLQELASSHDLVAPLLQVPALQTSALAHALSPKPQAAPSSGTESFAHTPLAFAHASTVHGLASSHTFAFPAVQTPSWQRSAVHASPSASHGCPGQAPPQPSMQVLPSHLGVQLASTSPATASCTAAPSSPAPTSWLDVSSPALASWLDPSSEPALSAESAGASMVATVWSEASSASALATATSSAVHPLQTSNRPLGWQACTPCSPPAQAQATWAPGTHAAAVVVATGSEPQAAIAVRMTAVNPKRSGDLLPTEGRVALRLKGRRGPPASIGRWPAGPRYAAMV